MIDFTAVLGAGGEAEERASALEAMLDTCDRASRETVGRWIAERLPVEELVPDVYQQWRPLVRDSLAFLFSHLSSVRLAPKLVEQMDLPGESPIETRLLKLITRMPGLQKLGQVLARHRRLPGQLRRGLIQLENGIADMTPEAVREIVVRELGTLLKAYEVELSDHLLTEASVSAILEFTWRNPETGRREQGVFKVVKPHVPLCFAEDLSMLRDLADYLATRDGEYGFASREVPEMLDEVRLLLEHELDFRREQVTLAEVHRIYHRRGAHAPKPLTAFSTDRITAMTAEYGVKVTDACRLWPAGRRRVASQIVEAVLADPIFSPEEEAIFHADPHAGNLFYDESKGELIILDWALTGRLTSAERRHVARMIIGMTLRDSGAVAAALKALSRPADGAGPASVDIIDRCVGQFFRELPHVCSLGALDAMRLLDRVGMEGVRFPVELVLIRKVLFTLDGVLRDIAGDDIRLDGIIAREFLSRLIVTRGSLPPPFKFEDYLAVQRSMLRYVTGLWAW
jgi:ubiquinone biosynthesis protein